MTATVKTIAFMGSAPIALPTLEALLGEAQEGKVLLAGIITQRDRPRGRGKRVQPNAIKQWGVSKGCSILQPEKPDKALAAWLQQERVDLLLVMAYGHILSSVILDAPALNVLNLHASCLPALRGAAPIAAAIVSGASETGVTLMKMVAAMDAGPILDVEPVLINAADTTASLTEKLAHAAVPLLLRNLDAILSGCVHYTPQDERKVTYTRRLSKEDGYLDFTLSGMMLERRIRAFYPWPGCSFGYRGLRIKIGAACALEEPHAAQPGTLLCVTQEALVIATGEGVLKVLSLQRPGGKQLPVAEFLRGFTDLRPGVLLQGAVTRPLIASQPFR